MSIKVLSHPYSSITVNETKKVSQLLNVCSGFSKVLVSLDPDKGSPKFQFQLNIWPPKGVLIEDWFVKVVGLPTRTVLAVNNAIGFGLTINELKVLSIHPLISVTTKRTLYKPVFW